MGNYFFNPLLQYFSISLFPISKPKQYEVFVTIMKNGWINLTGHLFLFFFSIETRFGSTQRWVEKGVSSKVIMGFFGLPVTLARMLFYKGTSKSAIPFNSYSIRSLKICWKTFDPKDQKSIEVCTGRHP